jgi:hypothetical protein
MESTHSTMGKYLISILPVAFTMMLLAACSYTDAGTQDHKNDFFSYQSPVGFSIQVPNTFGASGYAPSGKYYYFGYAEDNPIGIRTVEMYPDYLTCTPFALGVSDLQEQAVDGAKVWTGLVDAYDYWGYATYELDHENPPPCQPPVRKYANAENGELTERIDETSAYVLCSEKDDKRVVVCIQQMTDNPELAEEIFSTFRWTE